MAKKATDSPTFSARRQRYTVSLVPDGLVRALERPFQKHAPKPTPMEFALLAQQLAANYPDADYQKPQDLKRLADIGYRMVVPYTYSELQKKILPTYDAMKDLDAAATRLADAVQNGEQIGISGDYDCDGNCSTALMIRFLQESGVPAGNIHVHIPNRVKEGYGVNTKAVEKMAQAVPPVTLLLTLDNGTMAEKPIAVAKDKRMDVVVIDHHPNSEGHALPAHAQIVNPRRSDESAAITNDPNGAPDLAAVGVTWLVARRAAQKLEERRHYKDRGLNTPDPRRWLGLVAMATIGDVVSLKKPLNHALVCEGLKMIREGGDAYISSLVQVAGLRDPDIKNLRESDVAFELAPIINAPGRLGQSVAWAFLSPPAATAEPMAPLLQSLDEANESLGQSIAQFNAKKTPREKLRLAEKKPLPHPIPAHVSADQYTLMMHSDLANERRKEVGMEVNRLARQQAKAMLNENPNRGTLLLAGDDWHEGVVGIVAGRIKEEFGLPTMVASINRERGLCKASARNILGGCGDVGQVLRDMCERDNILSKAGGHPMAAGASFSLDKLDAARATFEERLGEKAREVRTKRQAPLAAVLDLREAVGTGKNARTPLRILKEFAAAQEFTAPHGQGREKPRIALYGLPLSNLHTTSSSGQHYAFNLHLPSGDTIPCSAFHAGGSKLAEKMQAATTPRNDVMPLLIGTVERNAATSAGFSFFVEDMVEVTPSQHKLGDSIAKSLGCKARDLCAITTGGQQAGR